MTGPRELVLYGGGPFAALMLRHFQRDETIKVAAVSVDRDCLPATQPLGPPLIPFEELADRFPPEACDLFVAIGYKRMRDRERMFEKAKAKGYRLANFISRDALVHDPGLMGENNVVLAGAILEPSVRLGHNNIVWSGAIICHDTVLGHHNFLAAGVIIGGECRLGDKCFFGFGATVAEKVRVADETLAGARSLILGDTAAATRYLGTPAVAAGTHAADGIEHLR